MKNKYYSMVQQENEATINIYGDITSWEWLESDVSSHTLSKELEGLEVDNIHVFINSYGGEVAEGLAIYNSLKRHKAKVTTYCDGFACSIASVIFMAGDERVMSNASLLMIHNPWTYTEGNANELRKTAEDLDTMESASIAAYMDGGITVSEEELKQMLDESTWMTASDALEKGFATSITGSKASNKVSQSVKNEMHNLILQGVRVDDFMKQKPQSEPEPEPENTLQKFITSFN